VTYSCWTLGLQRRCSWISARVGHSGHGVHALATHIAVVAASVAEAAAGVILYTRRRSPSKASAADITDADKCDCQPSDWPSSGLRQCVHVTVQF